jgi:hypothetical protein
MQILRLNLWPAGSQLARVVECFAHLVATLCEATQFVNVAKRRCYTPTVRVHRILLTVAISTAIELGESNSRVSKAVAGAQRHNTQAPGVQSGNVASAAEAERKRIGCLTHQLWEERHTATGISVTSVTDTMCGKVEILGRIKVYLTK